MFWLFFPCKTGDIKVWFEGKTFFWAGEGDLVCRPLDYITKSAPTPFPKDAFFLKLRFIIEYFFQIFVEKYLKNTDPCQRHGYKANTTFFVFPWLPNIFWVYFSKYILCISFLLL